MARGTNDQLRPTWHIGAVSELLEPLLSRDSGSHGPGRDGALLHGTLQAAGMQPSTEESAWSPKSLVRRGQDE